jgi:hypothetical protein
MTSFEKIVLRMDSNDWAIAAVVMLAIGIVCMRGLSGKTNF